MAAHFYTNQLVIRLPSYIIVCFPALETVHRLLFRFGNCASFAFPLWELCIVCFSALETLRRLLLRFRSLAEGSMLPLSVFDNNIH